jgi:glycosyltransferase involved in cell wall biosynthesis
MNDPLVSIIIAAYNAERFLVDAVQSVLSQTWKRTEVIVVDDGSTDGTLQVARSFRCARVNVLTGEHCGQPSAANRGFLLSQGDLIKFFDADDVLSPNFIELQIGRLQGQSDVVATATYRRFYDSPAKAGLPCEVIRADLHGLDWLVQAFGSDSMLALPLWLIPRSVFDRSGLWDERLSLEADYEFITRVLLNVKEVRFTPGATYYYRCGLPESLSQQTTRQMVESAALSVTLITQHLLGADDSPSMRRLCANLFQGFIYTHYPEQPELAERMALRVRDLGGSDLAPTGPPSFRVLRRLIGWRFARRLERYAVQHRLNRTALLRRVGCLQQSSSRAAKPLINQ